MAKKEEQSNALEVIIKEQNVPAENAKALLAAFGAPFVEAGEILRNYTDIKVTDEDDLEGMQKARDARLTLKKIRTGVDAKRKELKEDALKTGRVIDGVARYIRETIQPAEEYLELQEKFAELKAAEAAAKVREQRIAKLHEYNADPAAYNLDAMSDGMFNAIIEQLEVTKQREEADAKEKAEAEAKAEAERVAKQKETEAENERLKAEAAAKAKADAEAEAARKAEEEKAERERRDEHERQMKLKVALLNFAHNIKTVDDADNNLEALKAYANGLPEADQTLDVVVAAYNKSKSEIMELRQFIVDRDAKAEADRKAAEEAKAKAAEEEKQKQAMLAPDKDKLTQFAEALELIRTTKLPAVQSNAAQQIVNTINAQLADMSSDIKTEAAKL